MAKSKLARANERIAETVTGSFERIEGGVTGGYRRIEDAFVDPFLTRNGESVEAAKERLRRAGKSQA